MSTFMTQSAVMTEAAGRVDHVNDDVQAQLSRLQGIVGGMRDSWQGSAQVAFDNLMQRWNHSAKELAEALRSISDNIRANADAFAAAEQSNSAAFNHVDGMN